MRVGEQREKQWYDYMKKFVRCRKWRTYNPTSFQYAIIVTCLTGLFTQNSANSWIVCPCNNALIRQFIKTSHPMGILDCNSTT